MPPDPNQIDISLSLLPGDSDVVIKSLIEALTAHSAQMAAIMSGNEYTPVQGGMARASLTASTHGVDPVDVNIVSISPTASASMGIIPTPSESRAKAKLGAAEAAAIGAGGVVLGGALGGSEDLDSNVSTPPTTPTPVAMPDAEVVAAQQEQERRNLFQRAKDAVLVRNEPTPEQVEAGEPGSLNYRKTFDEARDYAMTYGIFNQGRNNANDATAQLKYSFAPQNLENIGTQLGGETSAPTNLGFGTNVLPWQPYWNAFKGAVGIGSGGDSAAHIGARVEAEAVQDAISMPYLNQSEARQLTHGAINQGWGEDAAEQDRRNFSRIRNRSRGGLKNLSAEEYAGLTENVRRDGSSTIKQLNDALLAMPKAATAARMGLDDFREASVQYAESLKAQGATFGRAISAGNEWASITGTAPEVGQQLRQAPMLQGALAGQGLLPQMQGLATESQVAGIASKQIRQMYDMFRPTMQDTKETTPEGTVVSASAREKTMAMIAQQMGIPVGTVEKLMAQEGVVDDRSSAAANIRGYSQHVSKFKRDLANDPEALSRANRAMRTGEGAADEMITRPEVLRSLQRAGVDSKDLAEVKKAKSATDFKKAAEDALANSTADPTKNRPKGDETMNDKIAVEVEIKMKGAAAKYFEDQTVKHDTYRTANKERNAGRGSHNSNNPRSEPPDGWLQAILGQYSG